LSISLTHQGCLLIFSEAAELLAGYVLNAFVIAKPEAAAVKEAFLRNFLQLIRFNIFIKPLLKI